MPESVLRELLAKTEKYHQAVAKAKDDYATDLRQILESFSGTSKMATEA